MGFEPDAEKVEINKVETQFEGGGVDLDSGDLSDASPVAAPKRTMRERHSVRARAVNPSAQADNSKPGSAPSGRRAGATGAPPVRRPIMRSNSEFGYLFNDSEPVDNHMDEQYSHRLDGLAYDGKKRGSESQYSDLFDGQQQSMVRRPENRSSAAYQPRHAQSGGNAAPAEGGSRRPKFSRRTKEASSGDSSAAYAAANELTAAELAARADGTQQPAAAEPVQHPEFTPDQRPAPDEYRRPSRREDDYYARDRRYEDDYYDEYDYDYRDRRSRRYADRRGPYDGQPDYPPYGQYSAYPPNYPYPYPYGQYPAYPPYGQYPAYPPYGYPPYGYPPGYTPPVQPEDAIDPTAAPQPVQEDAVVNVMPVIVPEDAAPVEPAQPEEEPAAFVPEPQPEPESEPFSTVWFPDDGSDSVDEEFAGLDSSSAAPIEQPSPEPEKTEPAENNYAAPSQTERTPGSARFNRRSRSGAESSNSSSDRPAPAEPARQDEWQPESSSRRRAGGRASRSSSFDWSDTSPGDSAIDWFGSDSPSGSDSSSASRSSSDSAGGSSRFNRRSRS